MKDSCQHVRLVGTLGCGTAGTKAEERAPLNARRCNKRWAGGSQRPPPLERPLSSRVHGWPFPSQKKKKSAFRVPFERPWGPLATVNCGGAVRPAGAKPARPLPRRRRRGPARPWPPWGSPGAPAPCPCAGVAGGGRGVPGPPSTGPRSAHPSPKAASNPGASAMPMLEIHPTIPYYYSESPSFARVEGNRRLLVSQRQFQARKYIFGSGCSRHGWLDAGGNCRSFLRPHPQTVT
jgi:hypothetical protein